MCTYVLIVSDCNRVCQNEGILDAGTCTCSCEGGFSGSNCESECNVRKLARVKILLKYTAYVVHIYNSCRAFKCAVASISIPQVTTAQNT